MSNTEIYEPDFVQALFDEMATTYDMVNRISSFGFNSRWRRQCLEAIPISPGDQVLDMMSGMGELSVQLAKSVANVRAITAVDFSPVMCGSARRRAEGVGRCPIEIVSADVLTVDLPRASFDVILSTFGLKTFSIEQRERLAQRVRELLKPGGRLSFLEISVPPSRVLSVPYLFYLRRVIPWIGAMLLGNPENYRLLGVNTGGFGDCAETCELFRAAGLEVEMASYFHGCATGIVGRRPLAS